MANLEWLRQAAAAAEALAAEAEKASDDALDTYMETQTVESREIARTFGLAARTARLASDDAKHDLRQAELGY